MDIDTIVQGITKRDKMSLARAITLFETNKEMGLRLLRQLPSTNTKAKVIGITGPPGVGKSTLIGKLAIEIAKLNHYVGIIATDPSSPISGGAILGNRIRMNKLDLGERIFIRSITTKGEVGGISTITDYVIKILEYAGYDIILLETVGAGQTDIEVIRVSDLVFVVLMPDLGDEIQALKAGILEIADAIILNKCDLPSAQSSYIKYRLTIPREKPIFKVSALNTEGIKDLINYIDDQLQQKVYNIELKKKRIKEALLKKVSTNLLEYLQKNITNELLDSYLNKIIDREITIEEASRDIASNLLNILRESKQ